MSFRTDLAIELNSKKSLEENTEKIGEIALTEIRVENDRQSAEINRPKGTYITVQFPEILKMTDSENLEKAIKKALSVLLPKPLEKILVVGLGNNEITPDSIGPLTATQLLATRHIWGEYAENLGLHGLKSVSVISPNVLGKTGIEAAELVKSVTDSIKPQAVIAIDALAAGSTSRLFRTVQLCNSGISPGSGVKNSRKELSQNTLGVPVIALGVPTVVDTGIIAEERGGIKNESTTEMVVTAKDVDILCRKLSEILARCLNIFLQPEIDPEIILSLV